MSKSNFIVRGGADFSGIKKEMDKTEKLFGGFENKINGAFKGISKGLGINLGGLTKVALIAGGTKALVDFSKAAIKVASDLEEIQNVTDTVFGSMSKDINDFSKGLIDDFGLGELSAKKYASYMGAMLKSSGIHGEAVKNMSKDLTLLTADMASFYNMENDEMFQKLMSGMSGQTMPLKQLGINMNIANLQAYALSQGIRKKWQEMSQAEQVMLRYNYLMSVTADAQGDFARNSWNWAHSTKILSEKWQEFMGIMGTFIKEIALPFIKILITIVDGLIVMGKALSKLYTIVTGKELSVETNTNIADTAFDAAEGENKLADGIGKAAKAAKKALAPFDELNILQNNLGSDGGKGGIGLPGTIGDGGLNTVMSTKQVDDGWKINIDMEEPKYFFNWFTDKWNGLKQMLLIPLMVSAPMFASIPNPIYDPDWGLTPPLIPEPSFEPIRNPVYEPNWNLEPPLIPEPLFAPIPNPVYEPNWNLEYPRLEPLLIPALDLKEYNFSLASMKKGFLDNKAQLERLQVELSKTIEDNVSRVSSNIKSGLVNSWKTIEDNYTKHKENMGTITNAVSVVILSNINQGLSALGSNTNATITTTQNNWQTWGKNLGIIAIETAKSFSQNMVEGFKVIGQNTISFANNQLNNMKSWGSGVLSIAGETAKGFVSNMVSGFKVTYNNFISLMRGMGEKVSGWWSENGNLVIKTTIVAGAIVGAGALAFAAPAAIPYVAGALGSLSAIPALATGGITNGPMLAMIGDNPGGKEVVSPLDGLLDMMVDAISITNTNNSGTGDLYLTFQLGDDTITDKVVSNINRQNRINGKTVITI